MPELGRALLAGTLLALVAALLCYGLGLARQRKPLLGLGRGLVAAAAALLVARAALYAATSRRIPLGSLEEFLVTLSLGQLALALAVDLWKGRPLLTMGSAVAAVLNLAVALAAHAPEARAAGTASVLHIATFLVSFVAFEVLFISAFTSLLVQRLLKRKEGLWLFEVTPSLETSRRAGRAALLVGFAAFTAGLLSAYLYARGASLPAGWRVDIAVFLTTFTWAAYLATLIFGFRSTFGGRWFHVSSLFSFGCLILTLLSLLLSDIHARGAP